MTMNYNRSWEINEKRRELDDPRLDPADRAVLQRALLELEGTSTDSPISSIGPGLPPKAPARGLFRLFGDRN
ncbi:MAG TPA: hypothetical protein VES97_09270 [Solirubrobacteraceae bacterium]|nr:hypothetical protein [Solirubrobacteraceae bacterium]